MHNIQKSLKGTVATGLDVQNGLWAIATVQIEDTVGDVIHVSGIDTGTYHNPPASYIKILAGHQHLLADGSPAVIGRVEEFKQMPYTVDGKACKSLAFRMSWAADGEGNLTQLASKYKQLFDGGYLDSFSVGMMYYDSDAKLNKSGGRDIEISTLYEISAVAVPCHPNANAIKAIKDVLGIIVEPEVETVEKEEVPTEQPITKESEEKSSPNVETPYGNSLTVNDLVSNLEPMVKSMSELLSQNKAMAERLDVLESAIVVLTDVAKAQRQDNHNKGLSKEQKSKLLSDLNKINRFLGE